MKEHEEPKPVPKEQTPYTSADSQLEPRLFFRDGAFVPALETPQPASPTENKNRNDLASLSLDLGNYNGYPLLSISFDLDELISLGDIISITGDQILINDPINKFSLGLDTEGNFSFGGSLLLAAKGGKPIQAGISASQNGVVEASAGIGYPLIGGVQTAISTEAKISLQGHIGGFGLSGSADIDAGTAWSQLYGDIERQIEILLRRGTGW